MPSLFGPFGRGPNPAMTRPRTGQRKLGVPAIGSPPTGPPSDCMVGSVGVVVLAGGSLVATARPAPAGGTGGLAAAFTLLARWPPWATGRVCLAGTPAIDGLT